MNDQEFLKDIQKLIGQTVEVIDHPYKEDGATNPTEKPVHTAHKPSKNARKKSARRKSNNFKRSPKNNQQK